MWRNATVTCTNIITGINLDATIMASLPSVRVTSEICSLTATLADGIIHHLMHCYQTIRQIAKNLLLKGGKFVSDGS